MDLATQDFLVVLCHQDVQKYQEVLLYPEVLRFLAHQLDQVGREVQLNQEDQLDLHFQVVLVDQFHPRKNMYHVKNYYQLSSNRYELKIEFTTVPEIHAIHQHQ